jgi:hypothetical protein
MGPPDMRAIHPEREVEGRHPTLASRGLRMLGAEENGEAPSSVPIQSPSLVC